MSDYWCSCREVDIFCDRHSAKYPCRRYFAVMAVDCCARQFDINGKLASLDKQNDSHVNVETRRRLRAYVSGFIYRPR